MNHIGVDGAPGGWIAVIIRPKGTALLLLRKFSSLFEESGKNFLALVDMPIGLPHSEYRRRECDHLARHILSPYRHRSVFSPPSRRALSAPDFRRACDTNKEECGVRISLQSYNISGKIAELDRLLRKKPELRETVIEAHPELAFYSLAGAAMKHHKKSAAGRKERKKTLRQHWPEFDALEKEFQNNFRRKDVREDDFLDAAALALLSRQAKGKLNFLPEVPVFDREKLPMRIAWVDPQKKIW